MLTAHIYVDILQEKNKNPRIYSATWHCLASEIMRAFFVMVCIAVGYQYVRLLSVNNF